MRSVICRALWLIPGPGLESGRGQSKPLQRQGVWSSIISSLLGVLLGLTIQNAMKSTEFEIPVIFMTLSIVILYVSGAWALVWISVNWTEYFQARRIVFWIPSFLLLFAVLGFIGLAMLSSRMETRYDLTLPFLSAFSGVAGLEWLIGCDWGERSQRAAAISSLAIICLYAFWAH